MHQALAQIAIKVSDSSLRVKQGQDACYRLAVSDRPLAPLCHRYKESVHAVFLQYPSGTGVMLAISGRYSAKIAYASDCVQNNIIVALAKRGVTQYFVQDSPRRTSLIDRPELSANLEAGGEIIADNRAPAVQGLNPSANPDVALKRCGPGGDG